MWDPELYLQFEVQRLRPAVDLIDRIPIRAPRAVVDLGCGTGHVTARLASRWPDAHVMGADQSPRMLAMARKEHPRIVWAECDIARWRPARLPDLIFSNAALHWLDDHAKLFPALLRHLTPGGCLAVQMPANHAAPSHTCIVEALRGGPEQHPLGAREFQATLRRRPVESPSFYHRLLAPDARHVEVWETEYLHTLHGDDPVVEWVRGTLLRPVLAALGEPDRDRFLARYTRLLRAAYPRLPSGVTLFPFKRLFLVAVR